MQITPRIREILRASDHDAAIDRLIDSPAFHKDLAAAPCPEDLNAQATDQARADAIAQARSN